jgi:ATPase subunit of ABC transporter with duplicated ATPase domains
MLSTNRLTIRDSIFDNVLVNDLSFSLNENDKIALIGSEGTGNSTLLKLLSGYELNYIETKGDIYRQVKPIYIEQNITYLWKDKSVYDFLFSGNKGRIDHLIQ